MYRINVLMSTYNGERFIRDQIISILQQEECKISIVIRDDGSTDSTVNIINNIRKQYPGSIKLYCEHNIGYRESFLKLLTLADEADYYAFADQDDYWNSRKCIEAITKIQKSESDHEVVLYASPVTICDTDLSIIGANDINSPNRIESYFIRHRLSGCTMVFTKKLCEIAKSFYTQHYIKNGYIDHDLVIGSIAYCYGIVVRDDNSYILHRRSASSVTSGGRGIQNRIKMERFILFERKDCHYDLGRAILAFANENKMKFGEIKNKEFLEAIASYKDSIHRMFSLLLNRDFSCKILVCNMETKLKVLLHNF